MILVADSGSTKCDWILIHADGKTEKTTSPGLNPLFHSAEFVEQELLKNKLITIHKEDIKSICFYGAGCSEKSRNNIIEKGLKNVFKNAKTIEVNHDLYAAAIATAGDTEAIVCILGTGSNACHFNKGKINQRTPSLGFILGDEASGAYFGKTLLTDWLYQRIPPHLSTAFEEKYHTDKEQIITSVYNKPRPNKYLAGFVPFISDFIQDPYCHDMVYRGLSHFISTHVWCYDNFRNVPIHFVGSIAFYFQDILQEVAINHRFTVGKIVKQPIEALAAYHLNKFEY